MSNWWQRVKNGLRHVEDRLGGRAVEVAHEQAPPELLEGRPTRRPAVDVLEGGDELRLFADVPGAVPEHTHLHVDGDRLDILAEDVEGGTASWYASFTLPGGIDGDHATAAVADGVLEVRLPMTPPPSPHRIPVKKAS